SSGNTNKTELEIFDASEAQANANADLFKVKDSTMPWQRHVTDSTSQKQVERLTENKRPIQHVVLNDPYYTVKNDVIYARAATVPTRVTYPAIDTPVQPVTSNHPQCSLL
ncbi:unnamed protein product, partial [Pocillopora meandrina]